MTPQDLTHPDFELTAPIEYWRALAAAAGHFRFRSTAQRWHTDRPQDHPGERYELCIDPRSRSGVDGILLQGIEHTGSRGAQAIIWALDEIQRRREERDLTDAACTTAAAVQALAKELAGNAEQEVLGALLARMSERTRYAIRAQLKDSGWLQ